MDTKNSYAIDEPEIQGIGGGKRTRMIDRYAILE